jgi:hypothetical protein
VELGRAQDQGRDGALLGRPLVGELGRAVPTGEPVGPDDRDHDEPPHPGAPALLLQVAGRGGEERGRRLLLRRGSAGRVDDALDTAHGAGQTLAGDDVDPGRSGDPDDVVPRPLQDLDERTSDSSGRPCHGDLLRLLATASLLVTSVGFVPSLL